jgi:hypothetical protein
VNVDQERLLHLHEVWTALTPEHQGLVRAIQAAAEAAMVLHHATSEEARAAAEIRVMCAEAAVSCALDHTLHTGHYAALLLPLVTSSDGRTRSIASRQEAGQITAASARCHDGSPHAWKHRDLPRLPVDVERNPLGYVKPGQVVECPKCGTWKPAALVAPIDDAIRRLCADHAMVVASELAELAPGVFHDAEILRVLGLSVDGGGDGR